MFLNKYKPKKLEEIPQEKAIQEFLFAIKEQKPIILNGQTGTGKSTIIEIFAKNNNYEVLELNASDVRNKEAIEKIIGEAAQQMSLFMKKKLIVLEEIDGLSGFNDRGGAQAIAKILAKTKHQIIMTTNDVDNKKIKPLKTKSSVITLEPIHYTKMAEILKSIIEKESVIYNEADIKTIARHANGDIRAAIADIEWCIKENKLDITQLIERNPEESIMKALQLIFKSKNFQITTTALDNIDCDLDESLLWIEENIPHEYKKIEEIQKAYDQLSKADIFRGRIRRWQYWRFLVYQKYAMTLGIALAKKEKSTNTKFKRETRRLQIWRAGMANVKKRSIAEKLANASHFSTKAMFKDLYTTKRFLTQSNITKLLELSDDEITWLKK